MINNDYPKYPDQASSGEANFTVLLIGFLGFGFLLFAVLSVYAFGSAHTATSTLNTQKQVAATAAASAQAAADKRVALAASESPYRSYTASADFGGFVISFPKNWSGVAQTSTQSSIQVTLTLNPDFVTQTNGIADPVAAKVVLLQQLTPNTLTQFSGLIQTGKIKQQAITVSGIVGTDLTGSFDDKRTVREILLPVRDKTLVFSIENAQYANEFNQILAQAKVNP